MHQHFLTEAPFQAQQDYAESGALPEPLAIYHLFGDPALVLPVTTRIRVCTTHPCAGRRAREGALVTARAGKSQFRSCAIFPSTIVTSAWIDMSSSAGTLKGSSESTTMSASFPTSKLPLSFSSKPE